MFKPGNLVTVCAYRENEHDEPFGEALGETRVVSIEKNIIKTEDGSTWNENGFEVTSDPTAQYNYYIVRK